MLTKVYLDGSMGEVFGREWELEIKSPREAILLVDANHPGLINWLRQHASKYTHYQVIVEYEDGRLEDVCENEFLLQRKMLSIRFVPIITGSGKWSGVIVGIVVIIIGVVYGVFTKNWVNAASIIKTGGGMVIVGVISTLTTKTPNRRLESSKAGDAKLFASSAFDGQQNTIQQGIPIPIIYGRNLVGSHVISAATVIEQTL